MQECLGRQYCARGEAGEHARVGEQQTATLTWCRALASLGR